MKLKKDQSKFITDFLTIKEILVLVWSKHGCLAQLLQLSGELKLLNVEHLGLEFLNLENIEYSACNLKFFSSHSSLFQHKGWQAVPDLTFRKPQKRSDKQSHPGWQLFAVAELSWEKSSTNCVICSIQKKFSAKCSHAVQDMEFLFMLLSNIWMVFCKIVLPTKDTLNPVSTVHLLSHPEIIEKYRKLESQILQICNVFISSGSWLN